MKKNSLSETLLVELQELKRVTKFNHVVKFCLESGSTNNEVTDAAMPLDH